MNFSNLGEMFTIFINHITNFLSVVLEITNIFIVEFKQADYRHSAILDICICIIGYAKRHNQGKMVLGLANSMLHPIFLLLCNLN